MIYSSTNFKITSQENDFAKNSKVESLCLLTTKPQLRGLNVSAIILMRI